jgi:hypothetical protein
VTHPVALAAASILRTASTLASAVGDWLLIVPSLKTDRVSSRKASPALTSSGSSAVAP